MSRIKSKIIWYRKNWENLNIHGKRQWMDTNHEVTQILKFSDKNFKAAMVKKKKSFNKQVWTRMKQMEK